MSPFTNNQTGITTRNSWKRIIGQNTNLKRPATRTQPNIRVWSQVLAKGRQFLLLIKHPPCYSYIQSSPVNVLVVIEERKHLCKNSRVTYELWNINSIRCWCWNIATDEKEVEYWKSEVIAFAYLSFKFIRIDTLYSKQLQLFIKSKIFKIFFSGRICTIRWKRNRWS